MHATAHNFHQFAAAVRAAGYTPVNHGGGHWQITGGPLIVNFYPFARFGSKIYVSGTKSGYHGGLAEAIAAVSTAPELKGDKDGYWNKGKRKRVRAKLMGVDPHCYWCRRRVNTLSATLDHKIPLSRGGLNNENNIVLACGKCNQERGSKMPELKPAAVVAETPAKSVVNLFTGLKVVITDSLKPYAIELLPAREADLMFGHKLQYAACDILLVGPRIGKLLPQFSGKTNAEINELVQADARRWVLADTLRTQAMVASWVFKRVNRGC